MARISQAGPIVVLRHLPSNICYGIGKTSHMAFNVVSKAFHGVAHFFAAIKHSICGAFSFLGSKVSRKTPPNASAIHVVAAQALPTAPDALKVDSFAATPLSQLPVIKASATEATSSMEGIQIDPATQGSIEKLSDDVSGSAIEDDDEVVDSAVEAATAIQMSESTEESSSEDGSDVDLDLMRILELEDEVPGDEAIQALVNLATQSTANTLSDDVSEADIEVPENILKDVES